VHHNVGFFALVMHCTCHCTNFTPVYDGFKGECCCVPFDLSLFFLVVFVGFLTSLIVLVDERNKRDDACFGSVLLQGGGYKTAIQYNALDTCLHVHNRSCSALHVVKFMFLFDVNHLAELCPQRADVPLVARR
jgi:hypothetical protein